MPEYKRSTRNIDWAAVKEYVLSKRSVGLNVLSEQSEKQLRVGWLVGGYVVVDTTNSNNADALTYTASKYFTEDRKCDLNIVATLMVHITEACGDSRSDFTVKASRNPIIDDGEYPSQLFYEIKPDYSKFPVE